MGKKKRTNAGQDSAAEAAVVNPPPLLDLANPPRTDTGSPVPAADPFAPQSAGVEMREPAWAEQVRERVGGRRPTGPPPLALPPEDAGRYNLARPFVELTLVHTGQYTGPTRGRVVEEARAGFILLTERDGLFFITWGNVAYWRYLPEH